jgi:hypothetical protein
MANEWTWSPLVVNGVPRGRDDEKAETLSTLCKILGVGLDRTSPHTASVSPAV